MSLTPLQKDALTEILNMHIGASAGALSEIVDQKIILSVPTVELKKGFSLEQTNWPGEQVITYVTFGPEFNGSAFVIFPRDKAAALVNACLGDGLFTLYNDFTGEDADVIKEICNIILNSLIGEFGNILDKKIQYSHLEVGSALNSIEQLKLIPPDYSVLELYTSFFLTESRVKGVILIALSSASFDMLINKIEEMLVALNA